MTAMEIDFRERVDTRHDPQVPVVEGYAVFEHIGEKQSLEPVEGGIRLGRKLVEQRFTRWPLNLYPAVPLRKRRKSA